MDFRVYLLIVLSSAAVKSASLNTEVDNEVSDNNNYRNGNLPRGVTFFQVRVYHGYVILNENVEVDTIRNYVVVESPPIGDLRSVTIVHDYNLNRTLAVYPASKHCYIMDRYSDIPDEMFYWFTFRDSTMRTKAFDAKQMGRYKNHRYNITEYNSDRSILTKKMLQYCTADMEVRMATMMTEDEMSPGSDEPMGQFEDAHLIYMPYVPVPGERVKRDLQAMAPHCCDVVLV